MALRCAIYCRVSSDKQEQNTSLDSQLARCREYAAGKGWEVVGEFREVASGYSYFERPKLQAAVDLVAVGGADVLLAYALDRISRDQNHIGYTYSRFEQGYHGEIDSVTEDIDNSPTGKAMRNLGSIFAEFDRMKLIERSGRGRRSRAEDRKQWLPGRKAAYGLRYTDEKKTKLEADPKTAPILIRMFRAVEDGGSAAGLAKQLTAEGVPTPTGRGTSWGRTTLISILRNPIYTGKAEAFAGKQVTTIGIKKDGTRGKIRRYVPREESERIALPEGTAPALISPETFARVQARIAQNKTLSTRNNHNPEAFLLRSGFVVCGICGKKMVTGWNYGEARTQPFSNYRHIDSGRDKTGCPAHSIGAAILDEAVWDRISMVLSDPAYFRQFIEKRDDSTLLNDQLSHVEDRLKDIAKRLTKLAQIASAFDDEEEAAEIVAQIKALKGQQKSAKQDREMLMTRVADEAFRETEMERLLDTLVRAQGYTDSLGYTERRGWLEALGVRISVWPKGHSPRWEMESAISPEFWLPDEPEITGVGLPYDPASMRPGKAPILTTSSG